MLMQTSIEKFQNMLSCMQNMFAFILAYALMFNYAETYFDFFLYYKITLNM